MLANACTVTEAIRPGKLAETAILWSEIYPRRIKLTCMLRHTFGSGLRSRQNFSHLKKRVIRDGSRGCNGASTWSDEHW